MLLSTLPVDAQEGVFGTFTNTFDGYLKNSTAARLHEMDEFTTIFTLRGARTFLQETLEVSTFIIYGANETIWTFKPSAEYAYNDALSLKGGVDFLDGDTDEADDLSERFYAEVRYSF